MQMRLSKNIQSFFDAYDYKGALLEYLDSEKNILAFYADVKASFPDELESWLNTGNYYYDIGSLNKAIEEYKIAIEKYEDSGEAHSLISQVYSYNEQMELALEHAQMAIDLEPTSDNYYNMGNLYMDETKYLEATTFYDQAIEVSEGFYDTYRSNKMYAYYLDHRYMKCIEFGLESLKVFPDSYDINWILAMPIKKDMIMRTLVSTFKEPLTLFQRVTTCYT